MTPDNNPTVVESAAEGMESAAIEMTGGTVRGRVIPLGVPYTSHGIQVVGGEIVVDLIDTWVSSNLPAKQMKRVLELASNVFEDEQIAKDWLNQPNIATDEKPPIVLLGTEDGLARVETLLHRIEYGVLA